MPRLVKYAILPDAAPADGAWSGRRARRRDTGAARPRAPPRRGSSAGSRTRAPGPSVPSNVTARGRGIHSAPHGGGPPCDALGRLRVDRRRSTHSALGESADGARDEHARALHILDADLAVTRCRQRSDGAVGVDQRRARRRRSCGPRRCARRRACANQRVPSTHSGSAGVGVRRSDRRDARGRRTGARATGSSVRSSRRCTADRRRRSTRAAAERCRPPATAVHSTTIPPSSRPTRSSDRSQGMSG